MEECGVRDKYAKPYDPFNESYFELYTTHCNPGLTSLFYTGDQKTFQNWRLEVGSGRKRGRIRESIDHQINTPVLEIAGNHDGSVYMVCPPDPNSCINIEKPYITVLMKDMHGYSSVEFTVLDTLGYSRIICAKNFRARCTIGELNCEIPMRLSPTWNYATVNLDATLQNAFGTKLICVQRIKINANTRVHRVYFSQDIYNYRSLPEDFRVRLSLTPYEKKEVQIYEEFLTNELRASDKHVPWVLPKLRLADRHPTSLVSIRAMRAKPMLAGRRVKVEEVPSETDDEKYSDVKGKIHEPSSNIGLLRDMLLKSIPPSKILLPTVSLIYPKDDHNNANAEAVKADQLSAADFMPTRKSLEGNEEMGQSASTFYGFGDGENEPEEERLARIKKCVEVAADHENKKTDWDEIQSRLHHTHHNKLGEAASHHRPFKGCGFNTIDLARYVRYREKSGEYDLFSAKLGNKKFLDDNTEDDQEQVVDEQTISEKTDGGDVTEKPNIFDNAFIASRASTPKGSTFKSFANRRSTVSPAALHDPAHIHKDEDDEEGSDSAESWIYTWAYNGTSWAKSREINQKLLADAKQLYDGSTARRTFYDVRQNNSNHQKRHPLTHRIPIEYRAAVLTLPRVMKEELRGTGGHYDIVFDNTTLPIQHY